MSDFDDPGLRRRLADLGGDLPDEIAGLAAVRGRIRRAARRRAAIWFGTAAVAVSGIAVIAARDDTSTTPATVATIDRQPQPVSTDLFGDTVPASTTLTGTAPALPVTSTPVEASTPPTAAPPATNPSSVPGPPVTHSSTPMATNPGATTVTSPPETSPPETSTPETSSPSAPTTTAPPSSATYSGVGGSITVRLAAGELSLISASPAEGFDTEVHDDGPTRVEVRFRSATHETVIRVDLVDGRMVPQVDEQGESEVSSGSLPGE